MGEKQAAVLAKQTAQAQDFAPRSLGVIPAAQSPLCITKQGSLCALGFSFVLHSSPSQRNATIYHFIPNKLARTQLKDRILPPASLLQANAAPVCVQGLQPINTSYPNPAAAYSNPFPSLTLNHKKEEDAERQQVLELERMWCGSQDLLLCCTHHGKRLTSK